MTPTEICDRLVAQRVVPVLRLPSSGDTERAVDCLAEAGFRIFEITLTTPGAIALIDRLARRADWLVGAGTVLDSDAARSCVDAGAQFLVSPCVVPSVARIAHDADRPALIGGFSPGEILAAHREGADIVQGVPGFDRRPASTCGRSMPSFRTSCFAQPAAFRCRTSTPGSRPVLRSSGWATTSSTSMRSRPATGARDRACPKVPRAERWRERGLTAPEVIAIVDPTAAFTRT